jgi:hypothetical protein
MNTEQLVPVRRASGNSAESIVDIRVEQGIALDRPAAGESHHGPSAVVHIAAKGAVSMENIMAAFGFVGVTPLSHKAARRERLQTGTRRQRTQGEGKKDFHSREKVNTIIRRPGKRNRDTAAAFSRMSYFSVWQAPEM